MRHGAGAHFARLELLLEVAQAHIAPDVARPVNQYGVGPCYCIKHLGHVVVWLNLNAVGLKCQTQTQWLRRLNHAPCKCFPVEIGPSRKMGVVIANRAVHFCHELDGGNPAARCHQTHHHVGNFLPDSGRTGRLAVSTAEHGYFGKLAGHRAQFGDYRIKGGQENGVASAL